jgi:hypothetical protein
LPFEGDWNLPDFTFQSGETLAPLRLHYITFGSPARDVDERVNIPHFPFVASSQPFLAGQQSELTNGRERCGRGLRRVRGRRR